MDLFLLQATALLRPIFLIEVGKENLFDAAAIGLFGALLAAFLVRAALLKTLRLSPVDLLIAAFVVWCGSIYVTYIDKADFRTLAKLVLPFLIYVIAKNVLRGVDDYRRMLWLLILSFAVPVTLSVGVILAGGGKEIYGENYWTGIPRWAGVFAGSHNLGHNMTFLLMAIVVYSVVRARAESSNGPGGRMRSFFLVALGVLALCLLWLSQVRTALLGFAVFVGVYLFFANRRLLLLLSLAGVAAFAALLPVLLPYLFPDWVMIQKGHGDITYLASARPHVWTNNFNLFARLPLDRQLGGVGLGNKHGFPADTGEGFLDSHNDYLDVLIQTGAIGFLIYVAMQVGIFRVIRRLPDRERWVFLALFTAVTVMNLSSNSYVMRFGLAQMFYMVLAYVEIRPQTAAPISAKMIRPAGRLTPAGYGAGGFHSARPDIRQRG